MILCSVMQMNKRKALNTLKPKTAKRPKVDSPAQPTNVNVKKKRKRRMVDKDEIKGVDLKKSSDDSRPTKTPAKKPFFKKPKKTTTDKTVAQNSKSSTAKKKSLFKQKGRRISTLGKKKLRPVPAMKEVHTVERVELPSTADTMSSNWKQLQQTLLTSEKSHRRPKPKSKSPLASPVPTPTESTPEIWFDDVDDLLIETLKASVNNKMAASENALTKKDMFTGLTKVVGMDCEMVGVGDGQESILARVSIVNHDGHPLYDKYVKPREVVTDYRTFVSGVRPEDLENAHDFETIQKEVADLLKGRILVGHALHNDIKVLFLSHPRKDTRDTAKFKPFRRLTGGKTPGLKKLAKELLGVEVQTGEHSSVQDAQAAMRIYTMHRKEWEKYLKDTRRSKSVSTLNKPRRRPTTAPVAS